MAAVATKGATPGEGFPDAVEAQRIGPPVAFGQKQGHAGYPQVLQQQPQRVVVAAQQQQQPGATQPPGWFGPNAAQAQLLSIPQSAAPRRFPGHFMPHRLCNHYSAQGWCRKAETCTFAHGWQELHPDVQHQMAKSMGLTPAPSAGGGGGKGKGKGGKNVGTNEVLAAKANMDAAYMRTIAEANFNFNVGAAPYVPAPAAADDANGAAAGDSEEDSGDGGDSPSASPSRRPVPAPLQLDDSPNGHSIGATVPSVAQPSPLGGTTRFVVRQPLPSPLHVPMPGTVLRTPLASPHSVAMISPSAVKSIPRQVLVPSSGTATTVGTALPSPARVATSVFVRPATAPWPGSPSMPVPISPATLAQPRNPISRNALLQARTFVQKLEQGPPGLAHCAPTPTTKAARTGFRYPQPGWVVTTTQGPQVQTVQTVPEQ